jgi:hypothetical protein
MNSQEELVLIFGVLHLVAAALGGVMLLMFMRSDEAPEWRPPPEDDESGGGGNDRISDRPKRLPPSGGIPLPDADQSPIRFRGPGRLSDTRPGRGRRATPEPHRSPVRSPTRR